VKDAVAAPKAGAAIHAAKANPAEAAPRRRKPGAAESEGIGDRRDSPVSSTREATLNIVALPWAEVFVDGPGRGHSSAASHLPQARQASDRVARITSFPAHVQTVELKPGAELSITHRFRR